MPEITATALTQMPRGGPNASWLDRHLQTDALEYTDRYDVDDKAKQQVITALDRMGTITGTHEQQARAALQVVADITDPQILEIGAGHGKLSAKIVELHPTVTVTVSDLDPTSVDNMARSDLANSQRVRTQVVDATAIDAADGSFDLVVFAQAFHHLPPSAAYRAIAEATRVGRRFLVIDLSRRSPLGFAATLPLMAPLAAVAAVVPSLRPILHDGFISVLRAYSRSAFIALGTAVDPEMRVQFLPQQSRFSAPSSTSVVFTRPESGSEQDL